MRMPSKAFDQSCYTQIAVDDANRLVVAATITQSTTDHGQSLPVCSAAIEDTGRAPKRLTAIRRRDPRSEVVGAG